MPDFKFGRLPGSVPAGLKDLAYYAAGPLPRPPARVDVPSVASWDMLANDQVGDCGPAARVHGFMAAAADTGERENFPSAQQVLDYYLTYTKGQDSGVVLSQFLAYVRQNGMLGHSISAYAPVSIQDINTLLFAVNAYDSVTGGITVTQGMMTKAEETAPPWVWTMDDLTGPVLGGHAVEIVAYDSMYLYAVSWGSIAAIAYPAWCGMADEAWCAISGELTAKGADGHGINLAALQADLSKLGS